MFQKSLIVGLGLIGASFAKSLRKANLSDEIFACDINFDSIIAAEDDGLIDGGKDSISSFANLDEFDLIVIAIPLSAYDDTVSEILNLVADNVLILDLSSLSVVVGFDVLPKELRDNFVFCHPIAGSEKSGFENSSANLFLGKKFVICSESKTSKFVEKTVALIEEIGGRAELSLNANSHNEIYALVSHLPQFLSFLTAEYLPQNITDKFFSNAFRLSNSDPEIWQGEDGIFALNEKNIEEFYIEFFDYLYAYIPRIAEQDLSSIIEEIQESHRIFGVKEEIEFKEDFLSKNAAAIFLQIFIVLSYLKISKIKNYMKHAGSGFKDFISIINIVKNIEPEELENLLQKEGKNVISLLKEITS